VEDRYVLTNGDGGDEAVQELADRLSLEATVAVHGSRVLVVQRSCGKDRGSRLESTEPVQMLLVACSRENLHPDRVAGGCVLCEQRIDSVTNR
jgi:hypothetical protein